MNSWRFLKTKEFKASLIINSILLLCLLYMVSDGIIWGYGV